MMTLKVKFDGGEYELTAETEDEQKILMAHAEATRAGIAVEFVDPNSSNEEIGELLKSAFEAFEPYTDQEAATIFAYVGRHSGRPGVRTQLAAEWADIVGWPQPSNWQNALTNATRTGLLRVATRGWREPTPEGSRLVRARLKERGVTLPA